MFIFKETNNSMNKKIAQYSALAATATMVMPLACTPDKNPSIEDNIEDTILNKTITSVGTPSDFSIHDSLDINNDSKADFDFFLDGGIYGAVTFANCNIDELNGSGNILTSPQLFDGLSIPVAISKNLNDTIESSSLNFTKYCYFANKYNANIVGFAGTGDKYLGFRFKAYDGTHYGWMKVSLTADYRAITIKDIAYDKRANSPIAVGAK